MTSLSVRKKTSLFRKQCIMEMEFPLISDRKMLSPFQRPSLITVYTTAHLSGAITNTSFRLAKQLLCRKWSLIDENYLVNTNRQSGSSYQYPSARTITAPPNGKQTMTSFIICKIIPLPRKWSVIEVKVMLNTN